MSIFKLAASSSGNVRNAITRYFEQTTEPKRYKNYIIEQYKHSANPENAKIAIESINKALNKDSREALRQVAKKARMK